MVFGKRISGIFLFFRRILVKSSFLFVYSLQKEQRKMRSLFVFLLNMLSLYAVAGVRVYPKDGDKALTLHSAYRVYVRPEGGHSAADWQELSVYQVEVDGDTHQKAAMVQFDMDGAVEVKVVVPEGVHQPVRIRPTARQIQPQQVDERTFLFTLRHPAQLSVECGGDRFHNLHLFANPMETETYTGLEDDVTMINWNNSTHDIFRKNCRLIYFGPGVHQPKDLPNNEISIPSNCTVYLAPGAVVKAKFRIDHAKNVRILGRGILLQPLRGFEVTHSRNILIEGITVVNPQHYTVFGGGSENVTVRNIKTFSSKPWSDGIDLMCCRNWLIEDVFLRTSDDCLAFYNHRWWYWGGSSDITVRHSVLWADVAHAMNVGGHGDDMSVDGETIENVTFSDIDVLNVDEDDDNYRGVMAVCCGDKNTVRNVLFEDIRVEDCEEARLIDLTVCYNEKYNRAPGYGIDGVTFRNVSYWSGTGRMYPSRLRGYNATCLVRNVRVENLTIDGRRQTGDGLFERNEFVEHVTVQ